MYIEDLISSLLTCKVSHFDRNVINSFSNQIISGTGLTQKQGDLAIKIIKKYSKELETLLSVTNIDFHLDSPNFKIPVRKITNLQKISVVDQKIRVEFPFDYEKIETIRNSRQKIGQVQWDREKKSWMFPLSEKSIKFLSTFIQNDNFELDNQIKNYLDQYNQILNNIENYLTTITIQDGIPKYLNQNKFIPELLSTDIVEVLFEARKHGITVWDETVSEQIKNLNIHTITKQFLESDLNDVFEIDSHLYSLDCLTDIIKNTQPLLFIIPGGDELKKLEKIFSLLNLLGFSSSQMSVMFRLSSKENCEFNKFVKLNKLNNPLTTDTRFVFVSVKIPKPLLESKIYFNGIISFGKIHPHYTVREFIKNKVNRICYLESNKQKEFNFGNL